MVGGMVFSVVLGTVYRRRQRRDLSSAEIGLRGSLAGLLVPVGAVVGAGIATGMVRLSAELLGTTIALFGGAVRRALSPW
jgi:hypothetical protein